MTNPLAPQPMTPDQVRELVERVRAGSGPHSYTRSQANIKRWDLWRNRRADQAPQRTPGAAGSLAR